jgi:TP901 family phage tail tape measure protein
MSKSKIGDATLVFGVDGKEFKKGMADINAELKRVRSEFKLTTAELGKHGTGLDKLKASSQRLTKEIELQKTKIKGLEEAHKRSVEAKGADARETKKLETQLNNAKAKLIEMENALKSTNKEIKIQSSGWYQFGDKMENVSGKMQSVGNKMAGVGKTLTTKVSVPIAAIGGLAIKAGADFEAGMSQVQAISGASGEDLKKLSDKAKEMGATTKFSATEASEALKYMAMAGWKTEDMLQGLEGIMNLAAASGEDLATTSDIVTDALTAFGMSAKDSSKFADLLASASSNSNTNVSMLGDSFKYVAPIFGSLKYSAEDAALALGLMANAGIKGSKSGTALRSAISNLVNPTAEASALLGELGIAVTNSDGSMKPFKQTMDDLRSKFKGLTEEQKAHYAETLFGKEAMSGMLAIINASDADYQKLTKATREYTGEAKKMAETMENNLKGQLTKLKSQMEALGIKVAEVLTPSLSKLVESLQKAAEWFGNLNPKTQEAIVKTVAFTAAIGPLLLVGGKIVAGAGKVVGAIGHLSKGIAVLKGGAVAAEGATGLLGTTMAGLIPKIGGVVAALGPWGIAIGAAAAAGGLLVHHLRQDAIPEIDLFGDKVSDSTKKAVGGFLELNDKATKALNEMAWSGKAVTSQMADEVMQNINAMGEQISAGISKSKETALEEMRNFFAGAKGLSETEQTEILTGISQGYDDRLIAVQEGEARIQEILNTASAEKRALTKEEQLEINQIQQDMVQTGVTVLSDGEVEARAIMQNLRVHSSELSAEAAADIVKNSIKARDESIKAANEQYDNVVAQIIRQRDEAGTITAEQADKLIAEAGRQRDESIDAANDMHNNIVAKAKESAGDQVNAVNWQKGEVASKWEQMKADTKQKASEMWQHVSSTFTSMKNDAGKNLRQMMADDKRHLSQMGSDIKSFASSAWSAISSSFSNIASKASSAWSSVASTIRSYTNSIRSSIGSAISKVVEWNNTYVKDKVMTITKHIKSIFTNEKNFAGTNYFKGGLTWVGEMGPELVELPRGSKIYDTVKSEKMMQQKQNTTVVDNKELERKVDTVITLMTRYMPEMTKEQQIVLDSGEIVGSTINKIDSMLGRRTQLAGRGI